MSDADEDESASGSEEEEEDSEEESGSEDNDDEESAHGNEEAVKADLALIFDIIKYAENTTNRIAATFKTPSSPKKHERRKKDPLVSRMDALDDPDRNNLLDKAIALLMEDGSETISVHSYDDT